MTMLSDVCLSVAYIGPKSRTERPRKTKIGTVVALVTHDSDTTFKVKRSKVKVTRPLYSPWRLRITHAAAAVEDGNVFTVGTYSYAAVGSAARGASGPTEGQEGRGILWRLPHSLLFLRARVRQPADLAVVYTMIGVNHCVDVQYSLYVSFLLCI